MQWRNTSTTYGAIAKFLHWSIVLLIIAQYVIIEAAEGMADGPGKLETVALHKSLGMLVLGLAPGVKGANRTGRPFTGDHAGKLLYATLLKFGLARGAYREDPKDGMELTGVRIANAVRCVPPENLPTPAEITTCNRYVIAERAAMPKLKAVLALGLVAHNALLKSHRMPVARLKFAHGAVHTLPDGVLLADSYHVSRYNTQTGRLTTEMFEAVVADLVRRLR